MQRTITWARARGWAGSTARKGHGRPLLAGLAAALSVLLSAAGARAQIVTDEKPWYVVVSEDMTQLKAGPGGVHYSVTVLGAGQMLRADGRTDERTTPTFLRVEYPPNMSVFVKADEAVVEGDTLRLTTPSRLRALNSSGGERGHWWFLLPENRVLPAGTVLPLTETLSSESRVYGYRVPAPAEARGYVLENKTRPATPEEVQKHLAEQNRPAGEPAPPAGEPGAGGPEQPVDGAREQPVEQPAAAPTSDPGQPRPADPQPTDPEPTDPTPPAPQPEPEPAPIPQDDQPPAPAGPGAEPRTPDPSDPRAARPVRSGEPASLDTLQSLYQQAQSQPIREAELDEVMAEFQRTIESLKGPDDQRTREFLAARLELLRLRADLQKSMRAAEQLADVSGERRQQFERDSAALDRARAYTVVGRLTPSTVYDGRRLPKMYRIQSVDEGFARTVAYLMPSDRLELDAKLGRVVGIVGETSLDPALRVNIIRPRRVDVLNPARSGEPAPDVPPAPAPPPTVQGAAVDPR